MSNFKADFNLADIKVFSLFSNVLACLIKYCKPITKISKNKYLLIQLF